ncbi:MAG: hypothetical protein R2932_47155 [Caldilineaceae bacterium]
MAAQPAANQPTPIVAETAPQQEGVVARITFASFTELQYLATQVDIWEVHHIGTSGHGHVLALLATAQVADLRNAGYPIEVDTLKSALLDWRPVVSARQSAGIPGFPCYRTVEETYADLQDLATSHPTLARWVDIGDSWDKEHSRRRPRLRSASHRPPTRTFQDPSRSFFSWPRSMPANSQLPR